MYSALAISGAHCGLQWKFSVVLRGCSIRIPWRMGHDHHIRDGTGAKALSARGLGNYRAEEGIGGDVAIAPRFNGIFAAHRT